MDNMKNLRPLGRTGIMVTPYKVKELSAKYSVTPSQVALNWLIHYNGDTVVAIPGATNEIHVKENRGAMSFRLSDEEMLRLDNVSSIFK